MNLRGFHGIAVPLIMLSSLMSSTMASATELEEMAKCIRQNLPAEIPEHLKLEFKRPDGTVTVIPAKSNYYLDAHGKPRANMEAIVAEVMADPEYLNRLNVELQNYHGDYEMSFAMKKPDGSTEIFRVPVHAAVIPITETQFNQTVASTQPVLSAGRHLLQKIYSTPLEQHSAATIGIDKLPPEEQKYFLTNVDNSLYLEPKFIQPQMRDYPFLGVVGWDIPFSNIDGKGVSATAFEGNMGTPSGLSNNIQLLEGLRVKAPKVYAKVAERMKTNDDTFALLKQTIDGNAKAWTGQSDGISVIVGPGAYNGAHPDVASIAMFSGMPLVNLSDLYIDAQGQTRLNTGTGKNNPKVTGIYNRMEESFLLQSSADGLPMRSPYYMGNEALGQKIGFPLKNGFIYDYSTDKNGLYIKDKDGNHVDVKRSIVSGEPRLQDIWDRLGTDPERPGAPRGALYKAVLDKKLYVSNLGARVLDDKRIFETVSQHIAPNYIDRSNPNYRETIHPPDVLTPKQVQKEFLKKDPADLGLYVVKVPDQSGGQGVYLLINSDPVKRAEVQEMVRANPSYYTIQRFADFAALTSVRQNAEGKSYFVNHANDERIFTFLGPDGKVVAGHNGVLVRVAPYESASTNTSLGASYGIMAVQQDENVGSTTKRAPVDVNRSILPAPEKTSFIGVTRRDSLKRFLGLLDVYRARVDSEPYISLMHNDEFSEMQRENLDLLGRDFSPMIQATREYRAGTLSKFKYLQMLDQFRDRLLNPKTEFPVKGVKEIVQAQLNPSKEVKLRLEALNGVPPALEIKRPRITGNQRLDALAADIDTTLLMMPELPPDETTRKNTELLEALKAPIPPSTKTRVPSINEDQANQLLKWVQKDSKVTPLSNVWKYTTSTGTGYCFGRAVGVHIDALYRGVEKDKILKVWAVGDMGKFAFHVATMVQAKEGGWWVIDPILKRPIKIDDWWALMKKEDKQGNLRLMVSAPQKFANAALIGPGSGRYNNFDLTSPFYQNDFLPETIAGQYFTDMMKEFKARIPKAKEKMFKRDDAPLPEPITTEAQ